MATSVKDFVGGWKVRWVTGNNPWLHQDWTIWLGTGNEKLGDTAPLLDGEYQTCVGFCVVDGDNQTVLSSADQAEYDQPLALLFSEGTLRWTGVYEGQMLRLFISFSSTEDPSGEVTYASLYGSTTYGDPDQVSVWGADGVGG